MKNNLQKFVKITIFNQTFDLDTMKRYEKGLLRLKIETRLKGVSAKREEAMRKLDVNLYKSIEEAEKQLKDILKLL